MVGDTRFLYYIFAFASSCLLHAFGNVQCSCLEKIFKLCFFKTICIHENMVEELDLIIRNINI